MSRPKCHKCKKHVAAINYIRNGKKHYRKLCPACIKQVKKDNELGNQLLLKSGYVKKKVCDRCKFISKHPSQMKLIYLDGDRLNVNRENLRTFCLNCVAEFNNLPQVKKSDLIPDYWVYAVL